jgi:hypothetical protein
MLSNFHKKLAAALSHQNLLIGLDTEILVIQFSKNAGNARKIMTFASSAEFYI